MSGAAPSGQAAAPGGRTGPSPAGAGGGAPGLADAVRAEWAKLRTLRTTAVSLGLTALFAIGLSALACLLTASHGRQPRTPPTLSIIQGGWELGLLAIMVLGVMAVTNEFSSGLIVSTYLATPRRSRVLIAKVVVFTSVVLVTTEVVSFADFFVGHAIIAAYPSFPNVGISFPNVLRAVVGMGIYTTLLGLVGMGAGAVVKHTAGGIAACVGFIFILPGVLSALPASWSNPIGKYWPTEAGRQVVLLTHGPNSLSAWWGTAVLGAFVVALLLAAGYLMDRRDA